MLQVLGKELRSQIRHNALAEFFSCESAFRIVSQTRVLLLSLQSLMMIDNSYLELIEFALEAAFEVFIFPESHFFFAPKKLVRHFV